MKDKKAKASPVADRMNTEGAAKYLGLAPQTLHKMRGDGRGPRFVRLGNRIFYRSSDLDAYLKACTVETADSRAA